VQPSEATIQYRPVGRGTCPMGGLSRCWPSKDKPEATKEGCRRAPPDITKCGTPPVLREMPTSWFKRMTPLGTKRSVPKRKKPA